MKLTISIEGDEVGRGLFFWLIAKTGGSIPTGRASQWYYEVGKALYNLKEEDLIKILEELRDNREVSTSIPEVTE